MFGKTFSKEFIAMQTRDKRGAKNPQLGEVKSPETISKLQK
jgi:hypothetical protein